MVAPDGGLQPVIALSSGVWTSAMIIGPAASGFLYSVHPAVSYGTTAALIAFGIGGIMRVQFLRPPIVRDPNDKPTFRSATEGLRFIRRTPILLAAISLDLFAVLFGGAVALLPVIAEEQLNVGDVAYGWLRAAGGIGAASMAAFLAIRPLRRHVGKALLVAVGIFRCWNHRAWFNFVLRDCLRCSSGIERRRHGERFHSIFDCSVGNAR
jgi:putative Mn2+ efflux pump MntP